MDLFSDTSSGVDDELMQNAQAQPVGEAPSFGQAFGAATDANNRYGALSAQQGNEYDFVQSHLDAYKAKTGQPIANPWFLLDQDGAGRVAAVRSQMAAKAQQLGDPSLNFPSDDEIAQGGIGLARQALQHESQISAGPGSIGSTLGGAAAGLVSGATAPLNAIALAAAPEGAGLVMGALRVGAAMGGAQAATEALTGAEKKQVNPSYGDQEAWDNVKGAALSGVGMELGGKALGAMWRAFSGARPDLAAAMPTEVQDAGAVAEKAGDLQAQGPFPGVGGEAAHSEAIGKIESDLLAQQPPELPQSAVDAGNQKRASIFYPGGSVDVHYDVAELGDLVTSHDANFNVNPDYPPELQPRDRASAVSQEQVQNISSNLEPQRFAPNSDANMGPPVVGPDNVVESGNGRTLALGAAYADAGPQAGAYKGWLADQGYDTSGMDRPVLVARRDTDMTAEQRAAFAHSTTGSGLRLNATEQAMSDARVLSSDTVDLIRHPDVTTASNRDFVRSFVSKLPQEQRGGMLARDGSLSQTGVRRIQAAMSARAYGDPALIDRAFEHPDPNIKSIANALSDSSGEWAKMRDAATRGDIPAGSDITPDLAAAVKAIMRARDEGRPVSEVLNQGDLFQSDTSQMAAKLFFRDGGLKRPLGRERIAENLTSLARDLRTNENGGLFGDISKAPGEVLGDVAKRNDEANAIAPTPLEAQMIRDATTPEAADKAMSDPKVDDAQTAELQRMMERGDNQIVKMDENGNVVPTVIDKELSEIDATLDLAKQIGACNTGGAAEAGEE